MEFQQLVDGLAMRLNRAVAIDDREVRLIAYSSHEGMPVDALRQHSILNRRVPPDVARYVHKHALNSTVPVRLPPAPDLGMVLARICVPIYQGGTVLGWLSVLENEQPLDQRELEAAVEAAAEAAVIFHRNQLGEELIRARVRELVPRLLGGDEQERRQAAQSLVEADLFVAGEPVAVLVTTNSGGRAFDDTERTALEGVLERAGRRLTVRHSLYVVRPDHGVLVVAAKADAVATVGQWLAEVADGHAGGAAYVGIGEVAGSLEFAAASYREASLAARVARVVGRLGRVACYRDLGVYTLLARIPEQDLVPDAIPAMARRLLEVDERSRMLVATLEVFLDLAGNVKATADALNVHRATLYYRLDRIEQVTGADLDRGEDRLTLHLGIKMARVAGLLA